LFSRKLKLGTNITFAHRKQARLIGSASRPDTDSFITSRKNESERNPVFRRAVFPFFTAEIFFSSFVKLNQTMTVRLRLFYLICAFFFLAAQSQAQIFTGTPQTIASPALNERFKSCEVYQLDVSAFNTWVKNNPDFSQSEIHLGKRNWKLELVPSGLMGANYTLQVLTPQGLEVYKPANIAFKGYEKNGNGRVALTIDEDFIAGLVYEGDQVYYIEPYRYYDRFAASDLFVVYERDEVIRDNVNGSCMMLEGEEKIKEFLPVDDHDHDEEGAVAKALACYQTDIALASDRSMFDKYGSVGGVEAHNIAVLNDVQTNYTGQFNHDIEFNIVTQFVVTGNDPWSNSNDAGTLLSSFRNWGNAGNFGTAFDVAGLWTDRDFNGGTIGIAYLGGVCNSFKYHCVQDFTGNSELLRVLQAHELGHNFNAQHDNSGCPGGWIMCPSVNTSNNWSNASKNAVNNFIAPLVGNCLAACFNAPPLVADFEWNPDPACEDQLIQFTDQSSGNITSRAWSFPGGTPSSSNQTNPAVIWNNPGTYNVSLTLNGQGGPVTTTKSIVIRPKPVANFTSSVSGLTVTFNNTSSNADTYFWDFGDGGNSDEENPVYTYSEAGIYTVMLTVTNDCGTSTKTVIINTAPTADFTANPTDGCATLSVQFTNLSSYNATSFSWIFPGGTPSSSNQVNPNVQYAIPGTYTVTLVAINAAGTNTKIKTNYITVTGVPSANFNQTVNGLTVNFNNLSNGATSYSWAFGDGNTSNETNPVYTYAMGGTYNVTLTSTNDCGSNISIKTVVVSAPPVAGFNASPTTGCAPLTVQFNNQSVGNPTSWNWSFPGGNPSSSTAQNPSVVYNSPGTYSVTLIVSNGAGSDTLVQNNYVTVNTVPTAGFNNTINGAVVTFSNTSQNATSYLWAFGDGNTSSQVNPTHTYNQDGTYTVTLTAANACGTTTATKTITIVTPPVAGFNASPTTGCAPLTVQFTSQSSPNVTAWNWSFPGGNPSSSTAQNPSVVYNSPGTYSVTLIVSNGAGSDTLVQNNYVTVNTVPTAGFNNTINGAVVTFSNTSQNATSYLWAFGDGNTSSQVNPTHTYNQDGTYTVTLTATNACGTTTATKTITIVTPPVAGFNASPTTGCAPLTVQFTSQSSPNVTAWNWSFPGGNPSSSTAQNPTVVYNTAGTYSVTLTVSNAAGSNTLSQTNYITVNTTPTAGFNSSVDSLTATFTNTSQNATSYAWDFGDGNTSNQANPVHTYSEDGTYTVVLSATNACGTTTFTQNVVVITAPNAGFAANVTTGCVALTVQFDDLSSANAVSWSWSFPGGTPSNSTEQNPTVVYNTPGVYNVSLTVTNAAGATSTFNQAGFITALGAPTTNFSSVVEGLMVSFNNNSQNATSYAWDFGDGSTSSESNPVHTYQNGGTYTVVLTATNNCGSTSFTQQIFVESVPEAAFTPGNSEGCAPFTVQFTNQSSPNSTSFAWTFEGGQPAASSEQNPSATWNQPGSYTVTLIVSNAAGNDTASATVTVGEKPIAGFSAQPAGLSVVLTNLSQNADSYLWDFGDGNTSNEANPTHDYGSTGSYTVKLTATNECGSQEFTLVVEISGSAPLAAFGVSENNGCVPFTVQFSDQSAGNPIAWQWEFPGGNPGLSTEQNPTVSYASTGTFPVTLIVTNIYGSDTLTQQSVITGQSVPTAGFSYLTNLGTVSFTNLSLNATSYAWNFGDGNTSSEANPAHTYTANGTYTIELTAINVCGASTLQQTVTINTIDANEPAWLSHFRLYPNPNTGLFTVEMSGTPYEEVEFMLFNAVGQLVKRDVSDFGSGSLVRSFDYGYLPAAIYTLRIQAGASARYVKVAVQR